MKQMPPARVSPATPKALARALDKIDKWSKRFPMEVSPSMAHLFIFSHSRPAQCFRPFSPRTRPIRKRIERLIGRDFV